MAMDLDPASSAPPPKVPELWTAPTDVQQRNDAFQYSKGRTLHIQPHKTPPAPFGGSEYQCDPNAPDEQDDIPVLMNTKRSDLVFKRLPRGTNRPTRAGHASPMHATLEIEKQLSTGREKGSQVVLCSVKQQLRKGPDAERQLPLKVVAKIYDPLYYPFKHWYWDQPVDVTPLVRWGRQYLAERDQTSLQMRATIETISRHGSPFGDVRSALEELQVEFPGSPDSGGILAICARGMCGSSY